jgi:hypothetical protein
MNKTNFKAWVKAAGVRAVKTMAQTFVALVGSATVISSVDWRVTASATLLSGVLSVATSLAGLPEVDAKGAE